VKEKRGLLHCWSGLQRLGGGKRRKEQKEDNSSSTPRIRQWAVLGLKGKNVRRDEFDTVAPGECSEGILKKEV